MKRTAWPRRVPIVHQVAMEGVRPPAKLTTRTLAVMSVVSGRAEAIPKDGAVRSEEYRRLVAALPCKHCGIQGYSQCAHPNTGKGTGIKTSDLESFPLCCDRPGVQGCHSKFDQNTLFVRLRRRVIEPAWSADTRRQITAMGQWPANLPRIED